jgi:hypothetical protein
LFEDQTVLFVDSNLRTILPRLGNWKVSSVSL